MPNLPQTQSNPVTASARGILAQGNRLWQVVAPSDCLVDPAALADALGEPLAVLPPESGTEVSAVPGAELERRGAKPVVDQRLLAVTEAAYLSAGGGSQVLARSALPDPLLVLDFCIPLQHSGRSPGAGDDRARIHASLSRFSQLRLRKRLDETLDIPPLPEAARRLLALRSDPNYDLQDLVQIIETDPSLAARLLGWANSAYYAADPPARSIDDAIMRVLGFDLVLNMAFGLAVSGRLRLPKADTSGVPSVWLESVATAAACEALARELRGRGGINTGLAYLVGLLANFGTLVLGHVFPPHYQRIRLLQSANRHLPTPAIDEQVLQLPREILAAELLDAWGLPEELVTCIRHQNTPDYDGPHASYVALLALAKSLLASVGLSAEPLVEVDPQLLQRLQTDAETAHEVQLQVLGVKEDLGRLAAALDAG